jgi:hypothetical protein
MSPQKNRAKDAGTGQPTVILKSVGPSYHGACGMLLPLLRIAMAEIDWLRYDGGECGGSS